ncbi:lanC-like protein 3 isoform X1 [Saccostrea echinata]|uniref:lanC-like protein 3 isoform X1 n=1 Tax=Saccostrea echinata TaxID=191078 RepID=UPI002A823DC1|nr:lanC-like protein 3 isoform X1 [Saccostrea echinata]
MRFFKNRLADFVPEKPVSVDKSKWHDNAIAIVKTILERMPPDPSTCSGGLYVGNSGVGYMLYYLATQESFQSDRQEYLEQALMYAKVNMDYIRRGGMRSDPPSSFILGQAGVLVLCSLLYKTIGDEQNSDRYIAQYAQLAEHCKKIDIFGRNGSDELFVGRAGYLCGVLTLRQKTGKQVIGDDVLTALWRTIVASGRKGADKQRSSPKSALMYSYYNTEYLGAAHGLSSILQMLLSFPEILKSDPAAEQDIHKSVDFMLSLEQNGNYPPAMDEVGPHHRRPEDQELVHWCHGAPGVVYLFARAYKVWGDQRYLDACLRCGEVTWTKGLLKKGPGICHGVAGSGYVFLLLYRLTGDYKHLHRAQQFAEFLFTDEFQRGARVPDTPFSLYEGYAGTVCFLADLIHPDKAEFPFFNVIF